MSKKVLIAEDDEFLLKMYIRTFKEKKWNVRTASNGEETLNLIAKDAPDVLLLDLLMPKIDGFAVLEKIAKEGREFPVIVLTNLSQQVDQKKCKELGAVDFFVKSDMDMKQLTAIVESYVGK